MKFSALGVMLALSLSLPFFPKTKPDAAKERMLALADEIQKAPAWPNLTESTLKTEGPKLIQALSKVKGMPPQEVRKLVRHLGKNLPHHGQLVGGSKIFLLNRLYFDVPASVKVDEFSAFSGWVLPPYQDGRVNMLFPLQRNKDGVFEITGIFRGYMGADYRYLAEFDSFAQKYGVRKD